MLHHIRVSHYYRKPKKTLFSIETLFQTITEHLPADIQSRKNIVNIHSSSFLRRLLVPFYALLVPQSDVNHITGDIHYANLFLNKKRTILTIHDVNLMYGPNPIKRWFFKWYWLALPIWRSEIVTVISEETRQELLKYVKVNPEKIRVVENCIASRFQPSPKAFNQEKPVILQIGTKPNKNVERTAEALAGIPCRFDIVGQPSDEAIEILDTHHIDYHIQTGLTDEEVLQKYQACDLVVFPSLFEGMGLPIIEANQVGRPVITSNLSSMPEVAGNAAVLVDPYSVDSIREGIQRVITDADLRETLVQEGFKNAKRFLPDTTASNYAALYREVYDLLSDEGDA